IDRGEHRQPAQQERHNHALSRLHRLAPGAPIRRSYTAPPVCQAVFSGDNIRYSEPMTPTRRQFTAMTLGLPVALTSTCPAWALGRRPLVIARGAASGDFPEATRGAYELAIREGA